MSKLYLTGNSDAIKTLRTARGHHWVKATVQSWEGSARLELYTTDGTGQLRLALYVGEGSTASPSRMLWDWPLKAILEGEKP